MKAGDKITIGGTTLNAKPHEENSVCSGCFFYDQGKGCIIESLGSIEDCWDENDVGLIFKEEV